MYAPRYTIGDYNAATNISRSIHSKRAVGVVVGVPICTFAALMPLPAVS